MECARYKTAQGQSNYSKNVNNTNQSNILQLSQYRTLMQTNHIPVINQVLYDLALEAQHIRLLGLFSLNAANYDACLSLALSDKYLLFFQNPNATIPTSCCPLNFDLKFEILRETSSKHDGMPGRPIGMKFQKELPNKTFQVLELFSKDTGLIYSWKTILQSKLNQRCFHTLFKAKKQIGKGAFATVYLAERLQDKKLVAVKAFSKQRQYSGEQGKQSLVNQINLMRKFNHGNIIKLEGVFETDNSIYVILEMLEGRQLHDRLKNNQIKNPKDVMEIIKNILSALKALSEKRVIHRDLKPENIMFRNEGSNDLVICDFGLATFAEEQKYLFVRCGTPGFVAPQIINIRDMSTKSDPISDVFSAGLIFHYLMFGKSIFEGKKYQEVLTQNRACAFNFQKDIYRSCDQYAVDLLKRLLDTNARTRITAQDSLRHPYFDLARFEQKVFQPRIECEMMVDEKEEDLSTLGGRSKQMGAKIIQSTNIQSTYTKSRRNSYRGSIYCEKQNESYHLALIKKPSLGIQLETPLRKSKRNSVNEKKVYYHQMRS